MKTSYLTILAFHIRDFREKYGVTQSDIASGLGITSAGWGKIENGKSSLSVENMMKFCKIINIDATILLDISTKSAKNLIKCGWSVSYSPVEDDNLIDGKNIFAKTHGMNIVMRKFIDGKLGSVLDKEFDDIIMKYATFYMVVAKNLRDDLI